MHCIHCTRAALSAALLVSSVTSAFSQDGPRHEGAMSEEEYLAPLARGAHPALALLEARVEEARASLVGARALVDPELAVSMEDPAGVSRQLDTSVSWQLPRPALRKLRIASADQSRQVAIAQRHLRNLELWVSARGAFAEWWVSSVDLSLLRSHRVRIDELSQRQRARARSGEISGLEARRVELEGGRLRGELLRAKARLQRGLAEAASFHPHIAGSRAEAALVPLRPALPAVDRPQPASPQAHALEKHLDQKRIQQRLANKYTAAPELTAGWQHLETQAGSLDGHLAGLRWRIPLLNRNRGQRARAAARTASLEAELRLAEHRAEVRWPRLLELYTTLRKEADEAIALLDRPPNEVEAATLAFSLGELGLTALLETLRLDFETRREALRGYELALSAHRELQLWGAESGLSSSAIPRSEGESQ